MTDQFIKNLVDKAAWPYRSAGRFAWHFARGKLRNDPVFAGMLEHGLIPGGRILDIGCGKGLLASWLLSAKAMHDGGNWPDRWPVPPRPVLVHGIELAVRDLECAKKALGNSVASSVTSSATDSAADSTVNHATFDSVTFEAGDMRHVDFGKADTVVILDVLHYVNIEAQNDVLCRVRDTLEPNGTLILRVSDGNGGLSFKLGVWVDYVVAFMRGYRNSRLYCRPLPEWKTLLAELGFTVNTLPMSQGTPFANMLLIARLGVEK